MDIATKFNGLTVLGPLVKIIQSCFNICVNNVKARSRKKNCEVSFLVYN